MTDHPTSRLSPDKAAELDEAVRISKLSALEDEEPASHDPGERELDGVGARRSGRG